MDTALLRRPVDLLSTRWPWTCLLYLIVHVVAGWVTVLVLPTIVLVPAWAVAWARIERVLVQWAGQPRIDAAPAGHAPSWREFVHVLLSVLVALAGTLLGTVAVAALLMTLLSPVSIALGRAVSVGAWQLESLLERTTAVLAGLVLTALLLWAASALAVTHARLCAAVLSPAEAELRRRVDKLSATTLQAQDALALERRELERRLHDGAQVHLGAAGARLGLLELEIQDLPEKVRAPLLADLGIVREQLEAANDSIRSTAAALIPRTLIDRGLCAALHELADGLPHDVTLECHFPRMPTRIEESVYLICTEALTNALKHADASRLEITATTHDPGLSVTIADDGHGGADPDGGGILGMRARAQALGGSLHLDSTDSGTSIYLHLPGIMDP